MTEVCQTSLCYGMPSALQYSRVRCSTAVSATEGSPSTIQTYGLRSIIYPSAFAA